MLKKLAMSFLLFCATFSFAQIKPSFQAFDADYLQLGEASKGFHHFIVRVDYAPWAFVAEGDVKVPQGDVDLLFNSMDNDQLYIVVAYAPSPIEGSDGYEYQAGIYDLMIYYTDEADDFSTRITNLKITLLPPIANDSWATGALADAQGKRGKSGDVFKNPEYANAIFQASAQPLSKAQAKAAKIDAANQKKNALKARRDSIAAAEQAERDAKIAEENRKAESRRNEKARQDSIAAATANARRKAQTAAPAAAQQNQNLSPRQRKLQAMQEAERKNASQTAPATKPATVAPAASSDPCEAPGLTPLQKKRCRMNSK